MDPTTVQEAGKRPFQNSTYLITVYAPQLSWRLFLDCREVLPDPDDRAVCSPYYCRYTVLTALGHLHYHQSYLAHHCS